MYIPFTCLYNSVAMDTLKNCSDNIKTACEKTLPTGLVDNIKKCNDLAEGYRLMGTILKKAFVFDLLKKEHFYLSYYHDNLLIQRIYRYTGYC